MFKKTHTIVFEECYLPEVLLAVNCDYTFYGTTNTNVVMKPYNRQIARKDWFISFECTKKRWKNILKKLENIDILHCE